MGTFKANNGGGDFVPAPSGMHNAVCVDMEDLGFVENNYNGEKKFQPQIKYVFQIAERMENGRPFIVSAWFTASLHEKAKLRATLESWLGRAIADGEEIDPETMVGRPAVLQVLQEPNRNGQLRANIKNILPLMEGMTPLAPEDFIRKCHRSDYVPPLTSAFDERAVAERKIAESNGQQSMPGQGGRLPGGDNYQPAPAYPHSDYGGTNRMAAPNAVGSPNAAPLPNASQSPVSSPQSPAAPPIAAPPMTTEKMTELLNLASRVHGAQAVPELETLAQKLFRKTWTQGSDDEASRLMHELRSVPASQSVAAKVEAAGSTPAGAIPGAGEMRALTDVEKSAPYSPFADEGEAGYRPDGHPDIAADEAQQPSLVAAGAPAYPAN